MENSKLTIAIPVFERKDFFKDALQSCLNQTVKCEIIVVDNASSHDFFEQNCRVTNVKYYRNSSNIGLFPNWNKCFGLAKTEFVLILSDDDILDIRYTEYFYKALKTHNNLDVYYTDFEILNFPSRKITKHKHKLPFGYQNDGNEIIKYGIKHGLGYPVITSAIRKKIFYGFETDYGCNDWTWVYTKGKDLVYFGENEIFLQRGHHNQNTYNQLKNNAIGQMSLVYIYQKLSNNNSLSFFYSLLSSVKATLNFIEFEIKLKQNNLFDKLDFENEYLAFYNKLIKNSSYYYILSKTPYLIFLFFVKIIRRLKIINY